MKSAFQDPSLVNSLDFNSSAYRIQRLLRRRGFQDVIPMDGKPASFMDKDLFKRWNSFTERKKLITEQYGGKEFERFVAQIIGQHYCNPATFSNKIVDLAPGGDFDILAELPGERLVHFETKTSAEGTEKTLNIPDLWNFLVRESRLGADMSVFLYDANFNPEEKLTRVFELLYSLAEHISRDYPHNPGQISTESWLQIEPNSILQFHRKLPNGLVYLYYPVLILKGGSEIKKNIGDAIQAYYGYIQHVDPNWPLPYVTRSIFQNLPHWGDLPKNVKKEALRVQIQKIAGF